MARRDEGRTAEPGPCSKSGDRSRRRRFQHAPLVFEFCRVTATPEEVILDFGLNPQPFATGRQEVKANQRIVMNFYTAKRLLTALG